MSRYRLITHGREGKQISHHKSLSEALGKAGVKYEEVQQIKNSRESFPLWVVKQTPLQYIDIG